MLPSRALLGSLLALLACTAAARKQQCQEFDVVVVGAGLGGLAAARALHDAGKRVVVLEGRKRIGGRLNSVQSGWKTAAGEPIVLDLRASWIEGTEGNPMTALAAQAGTRLFPTPGDGGTQYLYGQDREASDAEVAVMEAGAEELGAAIEEVAAALAANGSDASLEQVADELRAALERDATPQDVLQLAGIEMGVESIENEAGANEPTISAGTYPLLNSFEGKGEWAVVPEGFGQTLRPLSAGLDVRLGDAVESVKYGKGGVTVRTAKGKAYCGQRAVVVVPLGVLKRGAIRFQPPLPANQTRVFKALGSGSFSKLWMQFEEPFWDTNAM